MYEVDQEGICVVDQESVSEFLVLQAFKQRDDLGSTCFK